MKIFYWQQYEDWNTDTERGWRTVFLFNWNEIEYIIITL